MNGFARSRSVALVGLAGHVVEVEADIGQSLPAFTIIGLPDQAVNESKERIRSAARHAGAALAPRKITVNLSPATLPKRGSHFDVAVVMAVLSAQGVVRVPPDTVFYAELGLDGSLRPVRGVLPAVLAAVRAGCPRVVVAEANRAEAELVAGADVSSAAHLSQLLVAHGADPALLARATSSRAESAPEGGNPQEPDGTAVPDLRDVVGQVEGRQALEIAAAGGHHLLMVGPPGAGKTMLAERLPGILPDLADEDSLEVTSVHSLRGDDVCSSLMRRPPFQAPHHSITMPALCGGGSGMPRPGAISLAHRGVLFLDEARNGKHTSLAKEVTDECHRQETRKQRTARSVNAERGLPRVREDWAGGTSGGHEADLSVPAAVEVSQGQGGRDRASADRPGSEARPGGRLDDHG